MYTMTGTSVYFTPSPEPLATSTEVQELQKQTWAEIIDALKEKVPEVASLAASPA